LFTAKQGYNVLNLYYAIFYVVKSQHINYVIAMTTTQNSCFFRSHPFYSVYNKFLHIGKYFFHGFIFILSTFW